MKNLFERASSYWVRYDRYELKEGKNGVRYVTAAPDAQPEVYNPLENPEQLVLDALNVGLLSMGRKSEEVIRQGVMDFVHKYGLLGFMTALPTTPKFMEYEAVYLPKNQYIREESMPTEKYLELFFPFDKLESPNFNFCMVNFDTMKLNFYNIVTQTLMSQGFSDIEKERLPGWMCKK